MMNIQPAPFMSRKLHLGILSLLALACDGAQGPSSTCAPSFMSAQISNTENIIFTDAKKEEAAHGNHAHAGSYLVCAQGLGEHSRLLKEGK